MVKVRLIIFDIDGTLYRCDEYERLLHLKIIDLLADMLNCDRAEALSRLRSIRTEVKSISWCVIKLGLDLKEFYDRLAELIDPSNYLKDASDVRGMLLRLKSMGMRIAAHTNAGRSLASKVLSSLKIDPSIFDIIITSDDALPKPSPDGYIKILESFSIKPEEVVYVGDRYDIDLETAHMLGMKTILVGKREALKDVDFFIDNVLEVEDIVLKLNRNDP